MSATLLEVVSDLVRQKKVVCFDITERIGNYDVGHTITGCVGLGKTKTNLSALLYQNKIYPNYLINYVGFIITKAF